MSVELDGLESLDNVEPKIRNLVKAYQKSRPLHPSIKHIDFLKELYQGINDIITQLKIQTNETELNQKANSYAQAFHRQIEKLSNRIEGEGQSKSLVWVGLVFLLNPIMGQILSELSKWIWESFVKASGQ